MAAAGLTVKVSSVCSRPWLTTQRSEYIHWFIIIDSLVLRGLFFIVSSGLVGLQGKEGAKLFCPKCEII